MSREDEVDEMVYNGDYVLYRKFKICNTHSTWFFNSDENTLWYKEYTASGNVISSEPAYIDDPYSIFIHKNCELLTWDELYARIDGKRSVRYV